MVFTYGINQKGGDPFHTFLSANGLGGYCSLSGSGGVDRCDQGLLISAARAPDLRISLIHRLRETLTVGDSTAFLSGQLLEDGREEGIFERFSYDGIASWQGRWKEISVTRRCTMAWGENTVGLCYEICNSSSEVCRLEVFPMVKLAPKEQALGKAFPIRLEGSRIAGNGYEVYVQTDGLLQKESPFWQWLSYPEDQKDGRPGKGLCGSCCRISLEVPAGETARLTVCFSDRECSHSWDALEKARILRRFRLAENSGLQDSIARQLVQAADAFICRRDSTDGRTIVAGYPLFSDWGRDTMIALNGCCLAAGRYGDARSILNTFLQYEKDGLVPNLFPEGGEKPMYNTVDAALLLIDSVHRYYRATGDLAFAAQAMPVMEHIIKCYCRGTHHGIRMDGDGLIEAGKDLDQVTWMDVRIGEILPTPRHGKPVEVNAYWYNALRIMEEFQILLGKESSGYGALAEKVKASFLEKFWNPQKGCLKDVLSGTPGDDQIRCNQIWAVSMTYSMVEGQMGRAVVETVKNHLLTDRGLRSLSPEDPAYHPHYGGDQLQRDLAYHQGTVWVFPLGGFYRAYLKVHEGSAQAREQVKKWLEAVLPMLEEGCAGQLPEIYDGENPREGKGCFAQAWSVGELLTVYRLLEETK